jgi:subtilisin family serine protease
MTMDMREADALIFDVLGVAVVGAPPDQVERIGTASVDQPAIAAMEPERIVYALEAPGVPVAAPAASPLSSEFLRGYAAAANHLASTAGAGASLAGPAPVGAGPIADESRITWGLQATGAGESSLTGEGVRVAVLDTGFDEDHPDFAGRDITAESFVAGELPDDGHGHGTHCIGTACGSRDAGPPRYGVASGAAIAAGKVLNNSGRGADGDILAGIEWAITQRCRVASMSLGAATVPGQPFSRAFENAAKRALEHDTLIVAAAGNDSKRDVGVVRPVSHPANCPSILAIAAIDAQMRVASFSNQGVNPAGGQIDVAAPGVAVRSSWPMPTRTRVLNGTSMATPHVAGIAALFAEANPGASATELTTLITRHARRLALSSIDIGSGLVQAP